MFEETDLEICPSATYDFCWLIFLTAGVTSKRLETQFIPRFLATQPKFIISTLFPIVNPQLEKHRSQFPCYDNCNQAIMLD
ncbi:hypothetical protein QUA37_23630 [Microcoleus sp. Pol12A6]|uniref:hypothetical protein n=1 Tax=Microcoleus sp. Pol12B3 TaxID=3055394 RepID=UPI002FD58B5E